MTRNLHAVEVIHTWELYPQMIQWHQHHRQFVSRDLPGNPRIHINALLIMSSAVMIEGAISSLLLFYLRGPFSPFKSAITVLDPVSLFDERNRALLVKRIRSATWKDYKELFLTVTGKSLSELGGSSWDAVTHLFSFRNLLGHGEQLEIKGLWKPVEGRELDEVERSKDGLFKYLEKQKFLQKPRFGETIGWSFLADDIADHFAGSARELLSQLSSNVPDTDEDGTFPKRIRSVLSLTAPPDSSFSKLLYSAPK